MASMIDNPNRRARRAAAATGTAPVEPAIEAATERAAIERDPAADSDLPAVEAPALPADALHDDGTAVLPEPTLVAEPDKPMPIVTASPILAIEPGAIDVVQAEATAERVATGAEEPGDRDRLHDAAAGQPTLTIEGDPLGSLRKSIVDATYDSTVGVAERDWLHRGMESFHAAGEDRPLSLDRLVADLEQLSRTDPGGMNLIRRRFFDGYEFSGLSAGSTVTVIEVVGPASGRRRAGIAFGPQARHFLASDLRPDELDALRRDPHLAVGVSEMDEEAAIALIASTTPPPAA